ncbi:MAG: Uma2 family endonuclease [Chloroflexia bacterium]|nr:Uma2 family endonuclease [Chloroflexia bacterium]
MPEIMTLPSITLRSLDARWNYERWERELPDDGNRYEIIGGVLYTTTAPSYFHQWIIRRLDAQLGIPLENQGLAYAATAPIGLLMPGCDPVQPDFVLVHHARADIITNRRIRGVPDLIAEVLSPHNAEQDTLVKRHAYARAGVPEYWIIRPETHDVLVCHTPDSGLGDYTATHLVGVGEALTPLLFPITVEVAQLFAGAPDTTV